MIDKHTIAAATAVCQALGMPSRFAAEKEPVSPTLSESTVQYLSGLSDEALHKLAGNRKASTLARAGAGYEIRRRAKARLIQTLSVD